jgi:hypothetical protein
MEPIYGFNYNMREGIHAVLMPPTSRRIDLRVVYVPRGQAIHTADGTVIPTPFLELAPAVWLPLPEGDVIDKPFLRGSYEDTQGPMAVLQAMVDLGHRLGLVPTGIEDRSKEIAALKYHLEDMRKIAGIVKKDI